MIGNTLMCRTQKIVDLRMCENTCSLGLKSRVDEKSKRHTQTHTRTHRHTQANIMSDIRG